MAHCAIEPGGKRYGVWSKDSGPRFVLGGAHKANLSVGDPRLLILLQAFSALPSWALLSEPLSDLPFAQRQGEEQEMYSTAGEQVTLGKVVTLTLRLLAEGVDHTRVYRLSFSGDEPQVETLSVRD